MAQTKRSLAEAHPALAQEALFDATTVTPGSHKRVPWRCPRGHEWDALVKERVAGTGCPFCSGNRVLVGFNDLATVNPKLATEALFDPTTVTAGSKRKLPWRCGQGHEWVAAVGERTQGTGCPFCSANTVLPGFNDLATTHPGLASQALFDATTITARSIKKLPWRCDKGHEWDAKVSRRASHPECPYCSGSLPLPGESDLATTHPGLAAQALFDATTVSAKSRRRFRWRCDKSHEWTSTVVSRVAGGECPYCSGAIKPRDNTPLTVTHPALAAQALFDATTVTAGSGKKLPWRCDKGHEWKAIVANRANGIGCPICSGKAVLVGFNDLATVNPALAAQALFDATTVTAGSGKKLPWRCDKGHEWSTTPYERSLGRGCPVCSGNTIVVGFNDLATTHPDLAAQALFDPTKVTAGSGKKLPWRCEQGHEWKAIVVNRKRGVGCPVCTGREVRPGENDLATVNPELAAEALFDPTTVTFGTPKKLPWRCSLGHEWKANVASRSAGRACPFCMGKAVLVGFNDLATVNPELAAEALFDPTTVTFGTPKKLPWRCSLGHEWKASPKDRSRTSCPFCSGNTALPGFNDLATVNPDLAAQALFDATTVTAGSHRKLPWRCEQGHEWIAAVNSRSRGTGCPTCTPYGYDPSEPGWLYLMTHPEWRMTQIGITNDAERRLATHSRNGWELVDLRGPMDGVLTAAWERSMLTYLRGTGLPMVPSGVEEQPVRTAPGQRVAGEAWWQEDLSVESLRQLMNWVDESGA